MARYKQGRIKELLPVTGRGRQNGYLEDVKTKKQYAFRTAEAKFKVGEIVEYNLGPIVTNEQARYPGMELVDIWKQ